MMGTKNSRDSTKRKGLPSTRLRTQTDTDDSYLQQAGPNRGWQLSAAGSEGQTSGQQSAQDATQPAQVTVAQLGYCLVCSLLHGLQWSCRSVVRLETMPTCVCKQFWWNWEHYQMLLLFVTWYPDLYPEHPFASYWLLMDVTVECLACLFCNVMSWVQISPWIWATLT
jgi:hypothetical protein